MTLNMPMILNQTLRRPPLCHFSIFSLARFMPLLPSQPLSLFLSFSLRLKIIINIIKMVLWFGFGGWWWVGQFKYHWHVIFSTALDIVTKHV